MRRRLVASALLATLLSLPLGLAAAPPTYAAAPTDSDRATAALRYLWAAQRADGSIDGSIGETADFVIGTAAAGFDPATLRTCGGTNGALGFLAAASDAAAGDAGKTGKALLAAVAAGIDPSSFQGRNLPARLAALYDAGTGAYGDGSTFGQSFAILGLKAAGGSVAPEALAKLEALQGSDGSWTYGSAAPAEGEGDTNSTAIALMALAAAGHHAADAAALSYLHSQQLPDGGFPFQNSSLWGPPASDPDSDSVVVEALVAAGQDPEGSSWLAGSDSVLTHLRSMQSSDGGFVYPGMGESALVTSQVPPALMRVPYGAAVTWTAGRSLPAIACPTPTPSATSKPTPSAATTPKATPKRTARPTARPTAAPAEPAPTPAPTPDVTPSAEPSPTAEPSPADAAESAWAGATGTPGPEPTTEVAGAVADAGGPDGASPLVYVAAAALALLAVAGAGWVAMSRPGSRR